MSKKILYFYPTISPFIQKDLDIIDAEYTLKHRDFNLPAKWLVPLAFIKQLFFLLKEINKTDLIICRFVGYHSYLPALLGKLFKKPVILIIGGTESHYFPNIHYGNFVKPVYGWFTTKTFQNADLVIPVDESLIISDYTYDNTVPSPQGYKAFVKNVHAGTKVIYNGYDANKFHIKKGSRRKNNFLTVANNIIGAEFYRKGIDLIFKAAEIYPEYSFTIIGNNKDVPDDIPSNILLKPAVPHNQLIDVYNEHQFYFQLSMAEGFPNALCEAMLCGCIPIGSAVFGIPKIIGETGFILKKKDVSLLKEIISKAIDSDKEKLSLAAHDRIANEFPLGRRRQELLQTIETLMDK